jgi:DNA-binding NarL/FixJ family response regulator
MAESVGEAAAALFRAREADDRFWASGERSLTHQQERDQAVAEALSLGASPEQIADELGVLIGDVERMAEAGTKRRP